MTIKVGRVLWTNNIHCIWLIRVVQPTAEYEMDGAIIFAELDQITVFQLVYNPSSQSVSQAYLYSQLQLSLQSDPIALTVPKCKEIINKL